MTSHIGRATTDILIAGLSRISGHRFLERLGIMGMRESEVESPVFLHFLDCVWQLCRQFPSQFEFSEIYLTNIIDATHLGLFETFVFTSEHHRIRTLQVGSIYRSV